MKTTTNILDIKINYDQIDKDFVIIEIKSNTEKKPNPCIFDIEDASFISMSYAYGNCAYALMDEKAYEDLRFVKLDETISYRRVDSLYADQYRSLVRLFINALANYNSELAYNNLTGKFYKYDSGNKDNLKMEELKIDYDNKNNITTLNCNICNFSIIKKYTSEYPIYTTFGNNNTLKRCFKQTDKMYYKKGKENKRATKIFFDISKGTGRAKTMIELINNLNKTFDKYINISFKEYDILEKVPAKGKKLYDITKDFVKNYKISIVNWVKESECTDQIKLLQESLEYHLYKKINIYDNLQKNNLNIVIIHNKEHYVEKKIEDPHKTLSNKYVSQCITIEEINNFISSDKEEKMKPSLITILKELLIKQDIFVGNKFSYDDWTKYNFKNNWEFVKCIPDSKNKNNQILFQMIIDKEGTYTINKLDIDIFNQDECYVYKKLFNDNKNIELIIKDDLGNINYIERTDIIAMPSVEAFNNIPLNKTEVTRNKYYGGLCDINYYVIDNDEYYNVGLDKRNLQYDFVRASHLRRIVPVNNSKNIVKELLELMSVQFVKYNELTVLPYPVKYLNEYIEMNRN